MIAPNRGSVWSAALSPVEGHEQGGTRPCLVLSVNKFNHGPADLVVVVPITRMYKKIPTHVRIAKGEAGLTDESYIKCEEVRCISKTRLRDYWGQVQAATMGNVETMVRVVLGL